MLNKLLPCGIIPLIANFATVGLDAVASLAAFVGRCTKIAVVHDLRRTRIKSQPCFLEKEKKEARQSIDPFKKLTSFV